MRILIVEDEVELAKSMLNYLREYNCDVAYDAEQAIEQLSLFDYDCIILDIMLPFGNGLDLLQKLKNEGKADGVIIISAKNSVDDKIQSLNLGANDYLVKPFHLAELNARIESVIRGKNKNQEIISFKNLNLNLQQKSVKVDGQEIETTKTEFSLLLFLLLNKNKVVSKNAIAENLSKHSALYFDNFEVISLHIKNLKKKLGATGNCIETIYGTGYKLN